MMTQTKKEEGRDAESDEEKGEGRGQGSRP
jgi:hypothetical protein